MKLTLTPASHRGLKRIAEGRIVDRAFSIKIKTCWGKKQFSVGTRRLVVRSQRDRSTSSLVYGNYIEAEKQFSVGTRRLVVRSQRDRSTSSLVYGNYIEAEKQFSVGTRRLVVHSQRDRSTSSLGYGNYIEAEKQFSVGTRRLVVRSQRDRSTSSLKANTKQDKFSSNFFQCAGFNADDLVSMSGPRGAGEFPEAGFHMGTENNSTNVCGASRGASISHPIVIPLLLYLHLIIFLNRQRTCECPWSEGDERHPKLHLDVFISEWVHRQTDLTGPVQSVAKKVGNHRGEENPHFKRGRGGRAVSTLASHPGEPSLIPGWVTGFLQVGIVPDDVVGRRVFSGISRFLRPFNPALLHIHFNHPQEVGKKSIKCVAFPPTANVQLTNAVRPTSRRQFPPHLPHAVVHVTTPGIEPSSPWWKATHLRRSLVVAMLIQLFSIREVLAPVCVQSPRGVADSPCCVATSPGSVAASPRSVAASSPSRVAVCFPECLLLVGWPLILTVRTAARVKASLHRPHAHAHAHRLMERIALGSGLGGEVREVVRGRGAELRVILGHVLRHVVRNDVHTGHLVLLLPLHAAVLEPDLDLALGQAECVGDLDAPPPRQVPVEVELLLQLQRLVPGVRRALSLRLAVGVHRACNTQRRDAS
ncbi:hypothetical protein PR048_007951 [Dryococelus australis]|uniref:Uncharacterized protein n=1 Tax=Dryococelus australis TaxID=614101 RepID=A0ABQ9HVQ8_9NEOP|nr:hypothetical protein PR048_007951 [Dryococelus australis]